jgi:hypothetical protein
LILVHGTEGGGKIRAGDPFLKVVGTREFLEIGSEKPVDLGLLAYLGGIIGRGAAFFEGLEKFRFLAEIGKDFVVSALCRFSLVVTDEGTAIPVKHREEMPR